MQNYYSRKARGQNTVHKQWPVTVHSTVPQQNHWSYYCFRLKRYSPEGKSISPPVISAVSWSDPRLPPAIKGTLLLSLQQAKILSPLPGLNFVNTSRGLSLVNRMTLFFSLPLVYIYIYIYIFIYILLLDLFKSAKIFFYLSWER